MTRRKVKRIGEIYIEMNLLACDRSITSGGLARLWVNAAGLNRVVGGKGRAEKGGGKTKIPVVTASIE
jgi:hypothetical protein